MKRLGDDMVIVIAGPTAIGKTKLSIELAKRINGEIINADSTQVYKGLDIATAKVTKEEMDNIPHHLINIKELEEDYTVYDYQKDCRKKIEEILKKGKTPILVGGTGLYIKATLYDYQLEEEIKKTNYDKFSDQQLYEQLLKVDPDTNIHMNNRKRVERALQYFENHQIPFSKKEKNEILLYPTIFIGLTTNREILYDRINNRVDEMIKFGLLEEANEIYHSNSRSKAVMTPIGYKELFPYFENQVSLEDAIDKIKQNSRRYAKRQYTWFQNQMDMKWFSVDFNCFLNTIEEVTQYIEKGDI